MYIGLHNHTENSNVTTGLDCINRLNDLVEAAKELGLKGLAITDHDNLSGIVDINKLQKKLAKNEDNFKLIYGNEIYLVDEFEQGNEYDIKRKYWHFILIAKDKIGFDAIKELSSRAWYRSEIRRGKRRVPTLKTDLEEIVPKVKGHILGCTACFRKGTPVLTINGEKPIEQITSEDYILNRYGEWEKVNFPTKRFYQGKGIKIKLTGRDEPLVCTEDHQILTTTANKSQYHRKYPASDPFKWTKAKDLFLVKGSTKDMGIFPVPNIRYDQSRYIERKEWENINIGKVDNLSILLPDKIKITPELMRLFGLFLGDGHISINKEKNYYRVGFTFNIDEYEVFNESFFEAATKELGIVWSVQVREDSHRVDCYSSSIELVKLFYYLFGNVSAATKFVPDRLSRISNSLSNELVFGYLLADGYFRERPHGKYTIGEMTSASISKQLSLDIQRLLLESGIRSSVFLQSGRIDKNGTTHQDAWYVTSSNEMWKTIDKTAPYSSDDVEAFFEIGKDHSSKNRILLQGTDCFKVYIKEKEEIELEEEVYCLNVDSHSFVCNGIVVHNCLGSQFDKLVLDGDKDGALEFANWCRELFGKDDFFIELQPSKSDDQIKFNKRAIQFEEYGFRFVISTDSHYQKAEDFPLFEAFLRSQQEKREVQEYYEYARLQSAEEVKSLLDYLPEEFINKAFQNSIEIGEQIEFFDLEQTEIIPSSPIDENYQLTIAEEQLDKARQYPMIKKALESSEAPTLYCAKYCLNSLSERDLFKKEYLDQLNEEFDVFFYQSERLHSNFFSYFRCVQYIIELAWSIDCAVGPSRGSAGGCLTTFLMSITQEDPLQHQLFFWRFINKERIELPDVDFDLAPSKREQLFAKIREDRGELGLLQVATFKTLTLKAAIGNAGRGYRSEDCPNGLDPDTIGYLSSLIQIYRGGVATLKQTLEGDEEKGFTKNHSFIKECEQYPGLLDIIKKIEGLIVNSSTHASAIILFDDKDTILAHGSVMRAPNGALCTATELYSSSYLGMVKLDALLLSTLDCQSTCFKLLQKDKIIDDKLTLRECYQKYIDVNKIDYVNPLIWQKLYDNSVLSVFQFDQPSGRKGILATAPKSLEQMTCLNGAIRLITPEGEEDQIERFAKYGKNIELFEDELNKHKIPEDMKQIIHRELDKTNGCCLAQETLMTLCMELANFTMGEANTIRKVLAKKKVDQIAEQEQLFASRLKDRLTESQAKYLWRTFIKPQMNYSFCRAHGLGYSMVGVQCILLGGVLFPPIYWQTACLLQRSGALDDKAADYNKIAKAVSIISKQGVNIAPLNINKSENEFRLDAENNTIYFGFGGVKGLKEKVIEAILTYRPFENLQDFISKCNPDVTSLVCLTKAGAFDNFGPRGEIIDEIAELKCGAKLRLNGQNLLMLSRENLWPQETEELKFAQRLFNFTQYLKQQLPKTKEERELFTAYKIDSRARHYLEDVGYDNLIEVIGEEDYLNKETWKSVYDVEMNVIKQYLIDNQEEMLNKVNSKAKQDWLEKYFPNNDFAQWEIETMGLCFGEHPMNKVIKHYNNDGNPKSPKFANFEQLSQEPEPAYFFEKNGKKIPIYELYMICGIVIAKDKIKGMITLLTPTGPVDVKFGKNRFANYDKQISKIINGKKTVVEKSWFNRGEKVMIHGRRQDDLFAAKIYKNSPMKHTVYKITEIGDDGRIQIQQERKTGMMEESDEND